MAANLTGKVALITGGAQGLGRAFAECLLARGARVSLVDLNQHVGQKTQNELCQRHGSDSTLFISCDITKKSELEGAFQTTIRSFGGLDIVVNNAGIADEVNWERTIEVNLNALIHGCMLGMEAMRTDTDGYGGLIINIASTAGLAIIPLNMTYTASKFGVVGYSRSLAATFPVDRVGVRVACLCPSFANTEIREKMNLEKYKSAVLQDAAKEAERIQKMLGVIEYVSLVDVNQHVGQTAENQLRQRHGSDSTLFVPCDVTDKSQLEGAFQTTQRTLGGLDIVVNNAGIGDEINWERTIAINLNALIHGSRLGLEAMRTDKNGRGGLIINVASVAGLTEMPLGMSYTASKFGAVGYTRSLAETFPVDRVGVRVACLCPSFAKTEIMDNIREASSKLTSPVLKDASEKVEAIIKMLGEMEPTDVSNAFMRLVDDERAHGAVLAVTPLGQEYKHPKHLRGKL